jgi:hypothetical protein
MGKANKINFLSDGVERERTFGCLEVDFIVELKEQGNAGC